MAQVFSLTSFVGVVLLAASAPSLAQSRVEVSRDHVYVERDSGPLAMDLYRPEGLGPFPAVLVVHGGAWTMGSRTQLGGAARALAQHGYAAAAISYRLAPKHPFPAQIHDCQAAVRFLRSHAEEFKIDPARIGGYGYSAGGHLVALLGTLDEHELREHGVADGAPSARLQAVVAGGAPCDFRPLPATNPRLAYWLGGTRAEKPEAYQQASPAVFVSADDPPMFFFHGTRDLLVPARSPRQMVELLLAAGVRAEIHAIERKGHMEALFDQAAFDRSLAFLEEHLKRGPEVALQAAPAADRESATKGELPDGQ